VTSQARQSQHQSDPATTPSLAEATEPNQPGTSSANAPGHACNVICDSSESIKQEVVEQRKASSSLVCRRVARVVASGEWEEGLVLCDDGAKGFVVQFSCGQERLAMEQVKEMVEAYATQRKLTGTARTANAAKLSGKRAADRTSGGNPSCSTKHSRTASSQNVGDVKPLTGDAKNHSRIKVEIDEMLVATSSQAHPVSSTATAPKLSTKLLAGPECKNGADQALHRKVLKLEKALQDAILTVPKLRLESMEQRLKAATTENAVLKQHLHAAEAMLRMRESPQDVKDTANKDKCLLKAAQGSYLNDKDEAQSEEDEGVRKRGETALPRELQRLASAGTKKGPRFLAKEVIYPSEYRPIKGLFVFQSLLLTDPGLLEAIRADVQDIPDLVCGKYARWTCTNAQNNMTQLRVFFAPKHMREDEKCCAEVRRGSVTHMPSWTERLERVISEGVFPFVQPLIENMEDEEHAMEVEAQNKKCSSANAFVPPEKQASQMKLFHHVVVTFQANLDAHYDPPYLGHVIVSSSLDAADLVVTNPDDGICVRIHLLPGDVYVLCDEARDKWIHEIQLLSQQERRTSVVSRFWRSGHEFKQRKWDKGKCTWWGPLPASHAY